MGRVFHGVRVTFYSVLLIQNHVLTVIVDTKPCACLMALLTKDNEMHTPS